jgi:hypothetical protein
MRARPSRAVATAAAVPPTAVGGPTWVIGRANDLAWLIGGALLSYGMLGAHLFWGVPAVALFMFWVLAVDGTHVFATLSRTYLDAEERAAHSRLLRWSLGFFALGPVSVGLSLLAGGRMPYDVFLFLCSLWAYWHVVRQHYGVMVLYKKKARDLEPLDNRIDNAFLYVGLLAPFLSFAVTNRQAARTIGLDSLPDWASALSTVSWLAFALALLALAARQLALVRSGRATNSTKLLFLAAAVSVSAVLFAPALSARIDYFAVYPVVTSFHNVQYLAIVWFYHQNRRSSHVRVGSRPSVFVSSLAGFLGAGLLFTLFYRVFLGCAFSAWPGCDIGAMEMPLSAYLTVSDLGIGFLWGFALHHYYLDQKIWRVRHDDAVSRDLRLDQSTPSGQRSPSGV